MGKGLLSSPLGDKSIKNTYLSTFARINLVQSKTFRVEIFDQPGFFIFFREN
jgi:hypothetical protein